MYTNNMINENKTRKKNERWFKKQQQQQLQSNV